MAVTDDQIDSAGAAAAPSAATHGSLSFAPDSVTFGAEAVPAPTSDDDGLVIRLFDAAESANPASVVVELGDRRDALKWSHPDLGLFARSHRSPNAAPVDHAKVLMVVVIAIALATALVILSIAIGPGFAAP
jgi:hypothetical protein